MNLLQNKQAFRISGRATWQQDVLYLGYSASFIEFTVRGGSVSADFLMQSFPEGEEFLTWVAVFIDGETEPSMRFPLRKAKETVKLYDAIKPVTIRIMKYSEVAFSSLGIAAIDVTGEVLPPPTPHKLRMEFIGDSITCGYGIEGKLDQDVFTTTQENPWRAYACLTARALQAEFELVSWSGNGIISQYIDPSVDTPRREDPLMPELYRYMDLALEQRMGKTKQECTLWPSKVQPYQPDIVVVYLGTNDCSYTRRIPERNDIFQKEYIKFLNYLRQVNPSAQIISMIGTMQQELNETIGEAIQKLQDAGDSRIHYLELPPQSPEDGLATDSHPSPVTHQKIADTLVTFIKKYSIIEPM